MTSGVPVGVLCAERCLRPYCPECTTNRKTKERWHKAGVLVLTFFFYCSYHLSRKPPSVVKNALNKNCSDLIPPPDIHITNETRNTWCDWAPFNDDNSDALLGILDSAFLIGYAGAMFFSGFLAERMNLRYFLAFGMLSSGVFTYLFGLGYYLQIHSFAYYLVVQVLGGVAQSSGWPGVVTCVAKWFGKGNRGLIFGIWNSHTSLGNILGSVIAGAFVNYAWGLSFIVPAIIISCCGFICFLFLVTDPQQVGLLPPDNKEKADATAVNADKTDSDAESQQLLQVDEQDVSSSQESSNGLGSYKRGYHTARALPPDTLQRAFLKFVDPNIGQFSTGYLPNYDIADIILVAKREKARKAASTKPRLQPSEKQLRIDRAKSRNQSREHLNFHVNSSDNQENGLERNVAESGQNDHRAPYEDNPGEIKNKMALVPVQNLQYVNQKLETYDESDGIVSSSQPERAISFWGALRIPGVVEFALCLFFSKLVSYTFLYWLPRYIKLTSDYDAEESADLSTLFDVGGIVGAVVAGFVSDRTRMSATTCAVMLVMAIPLLLLYSALSHINLATNVALLIIVGVMVNGPYALITTSVSADLGTHPSIQGNAKALATVTALIDGTGSVGAAVGPFLAGVIVTTNLNSVFTMLCISDVLALILLIRQVKQEVQKKLRDRRARGRTARS